MKTAENILCDLDSRLQVNPDLVLREENDACALLFDPGSGRVHLLNATAVAIWKQLDGCRRLGDIVGLLAVEFDGVGPETAGQVVALARTLLEIGAANICHDTMGC